MQKLFGKEEIEQYSQISLENMVKTTYEMGGDIDENDRSILNTDFVENALYCGNCFDGFFEQINCRRFGDRLFVELQKLGDYDGCYKDWSMKKYMKTMHEICESMDEVLVSNYEYDDNDPAGRAFFIAFLFDINEIKYYEEIYQYCHEFWVQIEALVEKKNRGYFWDTKFEVDEMEFCRLYLTPFFKKIGFEQVIFNHGNKEYGKDYILVTKDIFGNAEYYGVQAKAGNMSGSANSDINEIANQINMGFSIPYEMVNGEKVYISKMIIAISGNFTDNAQTVIQNFVEKYKFTNIIFLSKKELENHHIMIET